MPARVVDDDAAAILELPLGGIRCWEQTMLRLVSIKAHPKVTMKTTGKLIEVLASYADWTTGRDIRPGWKRLMRDVGCSRRSIAYHLQYLREMGALVRIYHGTHLLGGTTMASVYAARIPNTSLHRAARDQARAAMHKAERARMVPAIGARHITCPATAIRSSRRRAAGKRTVARPAMKRNVTHVPHENCTPPGVDLENDLSSDDSGSPGDTETKAATGGAARYLAEWLVRDVPQFRTAPVGLVTNLLKPLAAAGWTREDLAYWLGLKRLPAWYIAETSGYRSCLDPWPLPAPQQVNKPFGLLAHRCAGRAWRSFELPSVVRRRAHARAAKRNAERLTAADRELLQAVETEPLQLPADQPELVYVPIPAPRAFAPETGPAAAPEVTWTAAATSAWLRQAQDAIAALGRSTTQPASVANIEESTAAAAELLAARAARWQNEGRLRTTDQQTPR